MLILLIGRTGQLGHELMRTLPLCGTLLAPDRQQLDLNNPDQIRQLIRTEKPNIIINSAAYTAVDQAQTQPDTAMRINAEAPAILSEEAQRLGAGLIHYSTDYVFDGVQSTPYTEADFPCPKNVYGHTKWLGEQAVADCSAHWIIRTSWIYGVHGDNFMKTIMRLAQERSSLRVVADQIGAPTWARRLAEMTACALTSEPNTNSILETAGLYHLSAQGETTWYEYAIHVVNYMRARGMHTQLLPEYIEPISTEAYPLPAARPRYSKLSSEKWTQVFKTNMTEWSLDMDLCLDEYIALENSRIRSGD